MSSHKPEVCDKVFFRKVDLIILKSASDISTISLTHHFHIHIHRLETEPF